MRSLAEARIDKAKLLRELQKREDEQHRARVRALREVASAARSARKGALEAAAVECHADVATTRAEADAAFRKAKERELAAKRAKKLAAKTRCAIRRDGIKLEAAIRKRDADRERKEIQRHRAELRRIEAFGKKRNKDSRSRSEKRSESDEAVFNDIPKHLHALFRQVRSRIKAGPNRSRSEAFLEYAEEHPEEWLEAIDEGALVRKYEAEAWDEQRRHDRAALADLKKTSGASPGCHACDRAVAAGGEVPF